MTDGTAALLFTAATIGFLHTLLGPDHYLPFVAMARAGGWSLRKTVLVTLLCGTGHVLGSAALGAIGIAIGLALFTLEAVERVRGDLAGWLLLAFGLVYFVWGIRRAVRHQPHTHWHAHADGTVHSHDHVHAGEHLHVHAPAARKRRLRSSRSDTATPDTVTPWILFVVFLFGPCEPLIPLLMYPAAVGDRTGVILVTVVFGLTTLTTMAAAVVLARLAIGSRGFGRFERYSHALAGLVLLMCGAAVRMGL